MVTGRMKAQLCMAISAIMVQEIFMIDQAG